MNIAKMRSKITIQKATVSTDNIGNRKNTWADYYSCSAYANLTSGKEYAEAGQTISSDKITFTVRYCNALSALTTDGYRIVFQGELYNITCIDDYMFRHETLKLNAERIQR